MTPHQRARTAFITAVAVLLVSGIVIFFAIARLLNSEQWVLHTHQVQIALGEWESAVARAGRARTTYILGGEDESLRTFQDSLLQIGRQLDALRELTKDNASQRAHCDQLNQITQERISLYRHSIELKHAGKLDKDQQDEMSRQLVQLSSRSAAITSQMRDEEQNLLKTRTDTSRRLFLVTITVLIAAFIFAVILLGVHYRLLYSELQARRQAEREARFQNAQLEIANRELDTFSYSVSHDLRAPLRAIDGFSLILLEDCHDKLNDEEKKNFERIRAAATRMQQLIDDMLGLARTTRAPMKRESVDLSGIVQEVAAQLKRSEPDRHVAVVVASGITVNCDSGLLRIVMENLLGNAWKFTARQPSTKIEFGIMQKDGQDVYFVRDNGAGFEMKYANKLFGPFQRLHGQNEFSGTGIGLATVQRIVHRHGGRIWAEAAPEKGATFYFTLEPSEAENTAQPEEQALSHS